MSVPMRRLTATVHGRQVFSKFLPCRPPKTKLHRKDKENMKTKTLYRIAALLLAAVIAIGAAAGCETGEDGNVIVTPESLGDGFETLVRGATSLIDSGIDFLAGRTERTYQ